MRVRRYLLILFMVSILFPILKVTTPALQAQRTQTLRVPEDYPTIDAAIAAASAGDTVQVAPGTYPGFSIDSPIKVIGSGADTSIIQGKVSIQANNSVISDIKIESGLEIYGIRNKVTNSNINNIIIKDNINEISNNIVGSKGIIIEYAKHNKIINNTINQDSNIESFETIYIKGGINNIISGNIIYPNTSDECIYLINSHNCRILNNYIENRGEGLIIYLHSSNNNIVSGNTLKSGKCGVKIFGKNNEVSQNNVENCSTGMLILNPMNIISSNNISFTQECIRIRSSRNEVIGNTMKYSRNGIKVEGISNKVFKNNFNVDEIQAQDDGINTIWYEDLKGNYWHDWTSPDDDEDGIVDDPYAIIGEAGGVDMYPLVSPYQPVAEFKLENIYINPDKVELGQPSTVSVNISNTGVLEGTYRVTLKVDGTEEQAQEITLSQRDSIEVSFTVLKNVPGIYVIEIDDSSGSLEVVGISTTISCSVSSPQVFKGESITVAGAINPSLPNRNVLLRYKKPDNMTLTKNFATEPDGSYEDIFTPADAGSWVVEASWDGDSDHSGATSQIVSFTVVYRTGVLRITVEDEKGDSLEGVSITSTSQPSDQSSLNGTSGSDGSVTFSDVIEGGYTVQAKKSGYATETGSVSVTAEEHAEMTITLEKAQSGVGLHNFLYVSITLGIILGIILIWWLGRSRGFKLLYVRTKKGGTDKINFS